MITRLPSGLAATPKRFSRTHECFAELRDECATACDAAGGRHADAVDTVDAWLNGDAVDALDDALADMLDAHDELRELFADAGEDWHEFFELAHNDQYGALWSRRFER